MSSWLCAHIVRAHQLVLQCAPLCIVLPHKSAPCTSTPKGFEPLRAEPNGFLVHLLSHSDTLSWWGSVSETHITAGANHPALLRGSQAHPQHTISMSTLMCCHCTPQLVLCVTAVGAHHKACVGMPLTPIHTRCVSHDTQHYLLPCQDRQRGDSNPCGQSPMDF